MSTNAPSGGFSSQPKPANPSQADSFEPMSPRDFQRAMRADFRNNARRRGQELTEPDFEDTDPGSTEPATLPTELEKKRETLQQILTPQELQDLRRHIIAINNTRRELLRGNSTNVLSRPVELQEGGQVTIKKQGPQQSPQVEISTVDRGANEALDKEAGDTIPDSLSTHEADESSNQETHPGTSRGTFKKNPQTVEPSPEKRSPVLVKQTPVRGGLINRGIKYGRELLARSSRKMFNRSANNKDGHHTAPHIESTTLVEATVQKPTKKIMRNGRFTSLLGKRGPVEENKVDDFAAFLDEVAESDEVKKLRELDAREVPTQPQALVTKKIEKGERENLLRRGLDKLTKTTREKRDAVLKELGPEGGRFITALDKGAHFLDRQVRKEIRLATGISLAAAGALALYATPAIGTVAVITAAGVGARVLGASAAYVGIKKLADKFIDRVEESNRNRDKDDPLLNFKVGKAERTFTAVAATLFASVFGQLAGEYLAPSLGSVLKEYFPSINEPLASVSRDSGPKFSTVPTAPEIIHTPEVTTVAPEIPVAQVATPAITPEIVAAPVTETIVSTISPEILHHTMKPGENLWSVVRKIMESVNFEGFNDLINENLKEAKIMEALGRLPSDPKDFGVESGNINTIQAGKTIDLTKAFTK